MIQTAFALVFVCVALTDLSAHETWLAPTKFSVAAGEPLELGLTSGMKFPKFEYAIKPDRVATARYRLNGEEHALGDPTRGTSTLRFEQAFAHSGLVTAWVTLAPKTLELDEKQIAEYFAEVDAPAEVRDLWASLKGRHQWRETYTKCAKSYLIVGNALADESWKRPAGIPLEILPLSNPATLKAGRKVKFKLLENGRPLPNIAIGLMTEENGQRTFRTTDSGGLVTFDCDQPGGILLFAVHLQWQGEYWQSYFTTMTLQVAR